MPLKAAKANGAFDAVKFALDVAIDSPSGLRWKSTYDKRSVRPGGIAGGIDTSGYTYTVTVGGFPIHCRHAVWMLTHNSMIPDGMEVGFVDQDFSNLKPENLELIDKTYPLEPGARRAKKLAVRYIMSSVPTGFYIADSSVVKHATVKMGNHETIIFSGEHAICVRAGIIAARVFGLVPDGPPAFPTVEGILLEKTISDNCRLIYTPKTKLVLTQRNGIVDFLADVYRAAGGRLSEGEVMRIRAYGPLNEGQPKIEMADGTMV